MKKRILHIIPSLERTGTAKQMSLLVRGLDRGAFDVHVAALSSGGIMSAELAAAGIPFTVIGRRWQWDPGAFWRLKNFVYALHPDLIHAWTHAANAYGFAVSRVCGVKCLVVSHRCVDWWKGGVELTMDRHIARRCARVVVNSPGVREFYESRGLPAEKICVISNGVALHGPSPATRGQLLAGLSLPEHSRLVGVMGPLQLQKRIKDAIWAADLLKVIRDDVHLLVLGDGPHRNRLEMFRDQVVICDKVHFLGERSDAERLLPHFDALWSTSAYEGQSNAILEAMASGVPVVATDIPGTRDIIVHQQNGYLVPVGARAGFARYTNNVLNDPALASRIGEAGRQRVREAFGVETMVQRYAELYRELLHPGDT
jgi:glycosyltransferase involved in cell wall biosynthesis